MPADKNQSILVTASNGVQIPVRVEINPRAKRLILRLDEKSRQAVAVAPSKRHAAEAVRFASERIDWAAERLERLPSKVGMADGARFMLRGKPCQISLAGEGRRARLEPGDPQTLCLPGDEATLARRAERYLRKEARDALQAAVSTYCERLGVTARRVTIKDTRSRWGSCTSDGRLAFSWRLIMAPEAVLDYVAAHECAHLLEMNHSPRFWAHVARCRPTWKAERAWLRQHGASLHAVSL